MITYLDIITIEEAKKYLRISDTNFDNQIIRYIQSSCISFEQKTRHFLATKENVNYKKDVRYYDFPISDESNVNICSLYFIPNEDVTLTLGYTDREEVPENIRQALFKMIEGMYYAEENNEYFTMNSFTANVIHQYKRFWI
jgi:hypothetical protein